MQWEAERLGSPEIEDQLDLRGLLDRQVSGFLALENAAGDRGPTAELDIRRCCLEAQQRYTSRRTLHVYMSCPKRETDVSLSHPAPWSITTMRTVLRPETTMKACPYRHNRLPSGAPTPCCTTRNFHSAGVSGARAGTAGNGVQACGANPLKA
jgi:hypothetical protein